VLLATAVLAAAACGSSGASPDASPPADAAEPPDAGSPDAVPPDADTRPLPDLTIFGDRAAIDLAIQTRSFAIDSCELDPDEACIGGAGERTLLHFSVQTPNIGNADLILGAPELINPTFVFSACHGHFHFEGYALYRLLDGSGNEVATGRKQAFCLLDSDIFDTEDPTVSTSSQYDCEFQGIQRGWSDVYHSRLGCQFIDITGTPAGDYQLEIVINGDQTLEELSYQNNTTMIPVSVGSSELARPTEACPSGIDVRAATPNRECGWSLVSTQSCTPGASIRVGCAAACGLGSCTGDPMLRICDADRADGNCSYPAAIGIGDDACGSNCPLIPDSVCPGSGSIAIYAAPWTINDAFTCDPQVVEL
jgi:hypothetical protein